MALRGRTRRSGKRKSNPAELILVNPGRKGSLRYKRRASVKRRMVNEKDISMALTRRRKPVRKASRSKPRKSASRSAAARKGAATRKRAAAARSRAAKKAAATRKRRRSNPAGVSAGSAGPRRRRRRPGKRTASIARKRRRKVSKKSPVRRRRRVGRRKNPATTKAMRLEKMKVSSLKRLAKKAGFSSAGLKKAQLIEKILSSGIVISPRGKRTAVTKKAKGRAKKRTKLYSKRSWQKAPRLSDKKWGKRKRARGSRSLSRAIHTIRVRRQYGTTAQRKKIRALGLGRRPNPGMAGMIKDLKEVIPLVGGSLASMVGMLALGNKVQKMAIEKGWALKLPVIMQTNIAPVTTSLVSVAAWAVLRMMKNETLRGLAGPVLMGGLTAAGVQVILGNAKLSEMTGLSGGIFGEYTALGDGIFGEYTALGGGDDATVWANGSLSEYTALGTGLVSSGGDDATDWAALGGGDDATMWADEDGVLDGGIFD